MEDRDKTHYTVDLTVYSTQKSNEVKKKTGFSEAKLVIQPTSIKTLEQSFLVYSSY